MILVTAAHGNQGKLLVPKLLAPGSRSEPASERKLLPGTCVPWA